MNNKLVKETFPRARLVVDEKNQNFFGIWTGDEYIAISEVSEEDAWEKATQQIYNLMIRKLAK